MKIHCTFCAQEVKMGQLKEVKRGWCGCGALIAVRKVGELHMVSASFDRQAAKR